MNIIEPQLSKIVPLFRALHAYHAALEPELYHCDGTDAEYLAHLEAKRDAGGRIFAHDTGAELVSYLLAMPMVVERDALRVAKRVVQVDHLFVSPAVRQSGSAVWPGP